MSRSDVVTARSHQVSATVWLIEGEQSNEIVVTLNSNRRASAIDGLSKSFVEDAAKLPHKLESNIQIALMRRMKISGFQKLEGQWKAFEMNKTSSLAEDSIGVNMTSRLSSGEECFNLRVACSALLVEYMKAHP